MKSLSLLLTAISTLSSQTLAFSLTTYDLGLQGLYPRRTFHSGNFEPPAVQIDQYDSRCDNAYTFLTPRGPQVSGNSRGPVILDNKGELVWMNNEKWSQAMDFHVQTFKGKDYLTFWTKGKKKVSKKGKKKKSKKSFVMLNSHYEVAYEIKPVGEHLRADSHEFRITPQGTALIAIYPKRQTDCTDLHLGKSCWIRDGWFQEIDIGTGKLLFEWKASEHIGMKDVFSRPCRKDGYGSSKEDAFDWFHLNAIDKTEEGDYVVSARYMHAIICISGKTGEILWQLGGKNNQFSSEDGALDFAWQHDITWLGNDTISFFDNHANSVIHGRKEHSKGMIIKLDLENRTAKLTGKYAHPDGILNVSQGSVQVLPSRKGSNDSSDGNVLVGFGNSPTWVEYSRKGEVLCSTHFAPHLNYELVDMGLVKSYRIFKHAWVGKPKTLPDVEIEGNKAWVSWNGATKVKYWSLQTAKSKDAADDEFTTIRELEKDGFETSFTLEEGKMHRYMRVVALSSKKKVLASSAVVKRSSSRHALRWLLILPVVLLAVSSVLLVRRLPGRRLRLRSLFPRRIRVGLDDGDAGERRSAYKSWRSSKWFARRSSKHGVRGEEMPLLEESFGD